MSLSGSATGEVKEVFGSRSLFLVLLLSALFINAGAAEKAMLYTVSIPNLKTASDESVVSVEIDITAGAIESFSNVPVGWYFTLDNNASGQTKIQGNTMVGAASLKPENLRKLRFAIKKNEFGDLKFGLSGDVSITKDYEKGREQQLKISDFDLSPKLR